jgi:hypothetical protein
MSSLAEVMSRIVQGWHVSNCPYESKEAPLGLPEVESTITAC